MRKKRVTIIGSGPAGLFAALELTKKQNKNLEVIIFEKNKISSGGMRNDCKLNLSTEIGMDLEEIGIKKEYAEELIDYIDQKFLEHGAPKKLYGTDYEKIQRLVSKSERCGLKLIPAKQRHVGTDKSKAVINSFKKELIQKGVEIKTSHNIQEIFQAENNKFGLEIEHKGKTTILETDYIVAAPGREGSNWLRSQADKLGIKYKLGPIEVGIRLELPKEFYSELTDIIYDPKFIMDSDDKELTRTFCTNPGGRIIREYYKGNSKKESYYLVNGDANADEKTENTNFAILTRLYLTEPLVDTRKFGIHMAQDVNRLGGGKPLVQKLGDFFDNKRSKEKDFSKKITAKFTPGDINLAYNYKIINKIKNMLPRVDHVSPGVLNPKNNLLAPEAKLVDTNYHTGIKSGWENTFGMTNVKNFLVAGDSAGKSRGIPGAALTGILAARDILNEE